MKSYPKLQDGSKIAVIGGGPAGSFFAHFILKFARECGTALKVDIYDRKTFATHLPKDCNMCAGVIGSNLYRRLENEGMPLDSKVIRHQVKGYAFHSDKRVVTIPQDPFSPIYTVFRGMTPKPCVDEYVSFDKYLLDNVIESGANYVPELVEDIILPDKDREKPLIKLREGTKVDEADLVVGAFGVNSRLSKEWDFGYLPPKSWHACQAEIEVEPGFIRDRHRDMIHIFTLGEKIVKFLAFTPKGRFLTISAIGEHVKIKDLEEVLNYEEIRAYLPEGWRISCHCHPKIPVTAAKVPFYERLVMVGDACDSRYLKNGIESAFFTSLFAAESAIKYGISKEAFSKYYYPRCRKMFSFDNRFGKFLFKINEFAASHPFFSELQFSIASFEQEKLAPKVRFFSKALWYLFTGEAPYKRIFWKGLDPRLQSTLIWQLLKTLFKKIKEILINSPAKEGVKSGISETEDINFDRRGFPTPLQEDRNLISDEKSRGFGEERRGAVKKRGKKPPFMENGTAIAIIGGGPSGASCAIKLLLEAQKENKNIRVVIFEGKDFNFHYNQCMGILAPKVEEYLIKELGISFPEELIKRTIKGYVLRSDRREIYLDQNDRDKKYYTVRRVEFDRFLLDRARDMGAEVVNSRVSGVEFVRTANNDEVRIYCESQYFRADAVVGAFGLDEAMLNQFEHATADFYPYKRPKGYLKTFITKIHADPEFISEKFNDSIFAFLLSSLPTVEFGAIGPKGDHIIINIAGKNVTSLDMDFFLNQPQVKSLLPEYDRSKLNYYKGKFPTSAAKNTYGHRYVIVGDATGWMKPFKSQGINIAMITGIRAALVMHRYGFSRKAFSEYAYKCIDLTEDYYQGILMRMLCNLSTNYHIIDGIIHVSGKNKKLNKLIYDFVSGDRSYKEIMGELFEFSIYRDLGTELLKSLFSKSV